MIRLVTLAVVLGASAGWAETPNFSQGGFNLRLQYGPGFWTFDSQKLASQTMADPGGAEAFVADLQNTHTVSISIAYTILGHASLGADLTATGWDLSSANRGGGGFAIGKLGWHPLELFFMRKERRPIALDFLTYFGVGYGIVCEKRGMDGLLMEWGAEVEYYFARFFGVGFFARGIFFNWDKYYLDYNNRDQPGAMITLTTPSGGSFWTFGLTLTFRAGD